MCHANLKALPTMNISDPQIHFMLSLPHFSGRREGERKISAALKVISLKVISINCKQILIVKMFLKGKG